MECFMLRKSVSRAISPVKTQGEIYENLVCRHLRAAVHARGATAAASRKPRIEPDHDSDVGTNDGIPAESRAGVRFHSGIKVQFQADAGSAIDRICRAASRVRQLSVLQPVRGGERNTGRSGYNDC